MTEVSGYKIFDPNWKCKDFQYKVGEVAELKADQPLRMCSSGFHFCKRAIDCLIYYPLSCSFKFAKVKAVGSVIEEKTKCATDKLLVEEELTLEQFAEMCTGEVVFFDAKQTFLKGKEHSFDDKPSRVSNDGWMRWKQNGVTHRDKGPAYVEKRVGFMSAVWFHDGCEWRRITITDGRVERNENGRDSNSWYYTIPLACNFGRWIGDNDEASELITSQLNAATVAGTVAFWKYAEELFDKWIAEW